MALIRRATAHQSAGYARYDMADGSRVERDTLQCVHCGYHWEVIPGSGRTRGWCMKCNGAHCGAKDCWECRPYKKMAETGHW